MVLFRLLFSRPNRSKAHVDASPAEAPAPAEAEPSYAVRIASYDSMSSLPRTIDLSSDDFRTFVDDVSSRVYALCREKGGSVPFVVIREAVENLMHAGFADAVVTVLPDGNTVRISDHGPGIADRERVFLPGFTTANRAMRDFIKGVGSGLPIMRESLAAMGGWMTVEDNLGRGAVVTISSIGPIRPHLPAPLPRAVLHDDAAATTVDAASIRRLPETLPAGVRDQFGDEQAKQDSAGDQSNRGQDGGTPPSSQPSEMSDEALDALLSSRQKKVFLLIAEMGEIGPSVVTKELDISLSTAYRDLVTLEELSLVVGLEGGKRKLTKRGIDFLAYIFR
ncbi:MAG TPA: hypothetical protein DCL63_06880 [Firmicutes bacterium]|nr:hypothetical protein [Bacillota bacterium]